MRSANFNRQITIEQKSITQDSHYGSDVVTWIPLVYAAGSPQVAQKFWAEVQDVMPSRSEAVKQGLAIGRKQTRIRIRYRNDIDTSMRVIVHGDSDETYQIVGGPAEIGGRKRMIELICEKYTTSGAAP